MLRDFTGIGSQRVSPLMDFTCRFTNLLNDLLQSSANAVNRANQLADFILTGDGQLRPKIARGVLTSQIDDVAQWTG
ncbi:hypothetical protein D3C72_1540580 [compost metagenome]